jgi:hypothetical protein
MREATFLGPSAAAGPLTLDVSDGECTSLQCASASEAAVVALLATGIVKASSGCVLIDDYDPRVQSVHCKRIAALVPHEPFAFEPGEFARYVDYRAALWNIERPRARAYAERLRQRLAGMHEAFAYPLIGALIAMPKLVVLDRPAPVYAQQILALIDGRSLLSTHADASAARAFAFGSEHYPRAMQA